MAPNWCLFWVMAHSSFHIPQNSGKTLVLIHFNKYFLSNYCVPGTILDSKKPETVPALLGKATQPSSGSQPEDFSAPEGAFDNVWRSCGCHSLGTVLGSYW